jgi:hypothetical protein
MMNELLEAARAAKDYLRSKEPMTGEVTELVVKLQVGIEEAEKERQQFIEHIKDQIVLNELAMQIAR